MKMVKVKSWSWKHFFQGTVTTLTDESVSADQVLRWIERCTSGGSGNIDKDSLTCKTIKVKEKNLVLTDVVKEAK